MENIVCERLHTLLVGMEPVDGVVRLGSVVKINQARAGLFCANANGITVFFDMNSPKAIRKTKVRISGAGADREGQTPDFCFGIILF